MKVNNLNIFFQTKKQSSSQIQNKQINDDKDKSNIVCISNSNQLKQNLNQTTHFPPDYAPEGVKDAWQKAVDNIPAPDNIKSIITRGPFFAAEVSTNLKYDSKSNITGRYMPGEDGYQDIYASPNFSYKQFINDIINNFNNIRAFGKSIYTEETKKFLQDLSKFFNENETGEIRAEISYENLPIESFALPEWFSKWIPDEAVLSDQVGLSLSNHGQSSNSSLSSDSVDELGEYVNKLLQYFQEELKNNGIGGSVDYHTSVLKNKDTSEAVHQAVKNRIFDDLRTRELMQSFGKSL